MYSLGQEVAWFSNNFMMVGTIVKDFKTSVEILTKFKGNIKHTQKEKVEKSILKLF